MTLRQKKNKKSHPHQPHCSCEKYQASNERDMVRLNHMANPSKQRTLRQVIVDFGKKCSICSWCIPWWPDPPGDVQRNSDEVPFGWGSGPRPLSNKCPNRQFT